MFRFVFLIILGINSFGYGFPEYFYKIGNSKKQKAEFIKILNPLINNANRVILYEREFVKSFFDKALQNGFREFKSDSLHKLVYLYKKYRIKHLFDKQEYLKKIDTIPVSLALAQGAVESAWGKSRFVREANNIFGHWTYTGNGLIPNAREEGKTHRIRIFNSLQSSVNAYVLNLNRNKAYKEFRDKRYVAHSKGMDFDGLMAAKTMINYSELKQKYVKIIQNIIKRNNLLFYDK